jgi:predicted TIM-barrel fold metal-dependent hydrolase
VIIDLWVNVLSPEMAQAFVGQPGFSSIETFLNSDVQDGTSKSQLIATMDELGVDKAVLTAGLTKVSDEVLLAYENFRDRLYLAATADRPDRPAKQVISLRNRHAESTIDLFRITPLVDQIPLNDRLYYPLYAACEELGIPVSINVGIPGPRVRSVCQDPRHLEDVLIDFPTLTVIGAHMGHPYEALLIQYMMKWPNLYLSNSAYSAKYIDPALVSFMGSSRGKGRVLFASDHPFLPMHKALEAARALPLDVGALRLFLGDAARAILER